MPSISLTTQVFLCALVGLGAATPTRTNLNRRNETQFYQNENSDAVPIARDPSMQNAQSYNVNLPTLSTPVISQASGTPLANQGNFVVKCASSPSAFGVIKVVDSTSTQAGGVPIGQTK